MAMLDAAKSLRTARKTSVILADVLKNVTQAQATGPTDGPDGWNVLFIVCHLHDYEMILAERVRLILEQDQPTLPAMNNSALAESRHYAERSLAEEFEACVQKRRRLIAQLEALDAAAWTRRGVHPVQGEGSLLDVVINAGLHDVDHTEQIIRVLASDEGGA